MFSTKFFLFFFSLFATQSIFLVEASAPVSCMVDAKTSQITILDPSLRTSSFICEKGHRVTGTPILFPHSHPYKCRQTWQELIAQVKELKKPLSFALCMDRNNNFVFYLTSPDCKLITDLNLSHTPVAHYRMLPYSQNPNLPLSIMISKIETPDAFAQLTVENSEREIKIERQHYEHEFKNTYRQLPNENEIGSYYENLHHNQPHFPLPPLFPFLPLPCFFVQDPKTKQLAGISFCDTSLETYYLSQKNALGKIAAPVLPLTECPVGCTATWETLINHQEPLYFLLCSDDKDRLFFYQSHSNHHTLVPLDKDHKPLGHYVIPPLTLPSDTTTNYGATFPLIQKDNFHLFSSLTYSQQGQTSVTSTLQGLAHPFSPYEGVKYPWEERLDTQILDAWKKSQAKEKALAPAASAKVFPLSTTTVTAASVEILSNSPESSLTNETAAISEICSESRQTPLCTSLDNVSESTQTSSNPTPVLPTKKQLKEAQKAQAAEKALQKFLHEQEEAKRKALKEQERKEAQRKAQKERDQAAQRKKEKEAELKNQAYEKAERRTQQLAQQRQAAELKAIRAAQALKKEREPFENALAHVQTLANAKEWNACLEALANPLLERENCFENEKQRNAFLILKAEIITQSLDHSGTSALLVQRCEQLRDPLFALARKDIHRASSVEEVESIKAAALYLIRLFRNDSSERLYSYCNAGIQAGLVECKIMDWYLSLLATEGKQCSLSSCFHKTLLTRLKTVETDPNALTFPEYWICHIIGGTSRCLGLSAAERKKVACQYLKEARHHCGEKKLFRELEKKMVDIMVPIVFFEPSSAQQSIPIHITLSSTLKPQVKPPVAEQMPCASIVSVQPTEDEICAFTKQVTTPLALSSLDDEVFSPHMEALQKEYTAFLARLDVERAFKVFNTCLIEASNAATSLNTVIKIFPLFSALYTRFSQTSCDDRAHYLVQFDALKKDTITLFDASLAQSLLQGRTESELQLILVGVLGCVQNIQISPQEQATPTSSPKKCAQAPTNRPLRTYLEECTKENFRKKFEILIRECKPVPCGSYIETLARGFELGISRKLMIQHVEEVLQDNRPNLLYSLLDSNRSFFVKHFGESATAFFSNAINLPITEIAKATDLFCRAKGRQKVARTFVPLVELTANHLGYSTGPRFAPTRQACYPLLAQLFEKETDPKLISEVIFNLTIPPFDRLYLFSLAINQCSRINNANYSNRLVEFYHNTQNRFGEETFCKDKERIATEWPEFDMAGMEKTVNKFLKKQGLPTLTQCLPNLPPVTTLEESTLALASFRQELQSRITATEPVSLDTLFAFLKANVYQKNLSTNVMRQELEALKSTHPNLMLELIKKYPAFFHVYFLPPGKESGMQEFILTQVQELIPSYDILASLKQAYLADPKTEVFVRLVSYIANHLQNAQGGKDYLLLQNLLYPDLFEIYAKASSEDILYALSHICFSPLEQLYILHISFLQIYRFPAAYQEQVVRIYEQRLKPRLLTHDFLELHARSMHNLPVLDVALTTVNLFFTEMKLSTLTPENVPVHATSSS